MKGNKEYRRTSWIDPRVEVRPSPIHGTGTFAVARIRQGEVVIIWGGTLFTKEEIEAGKAIARSVAAIDEGLYMGGTLEEGNSPDDFMNHSCDPDVWMQDEVTLVARRGIAAGEELTMDYAMVESDESWVAPWECHCGSPLCRKVITGKDWRRRELQERYGNHFSPFINERIRKLC